MAKFRFIRDYDDHDPVVLGQAETDMGDEQAEQLVQMAWGDFQDSRPDSDSQFIDWLVEKHGFRKVDDDFTDVIIG